jgi:hypothetical protein
VSAHDQAILARLDVIAEDVDTREFDGAADPLANGRVDG